MLLQGRKRNRALAVASGLARGADRLLSWVLYLILVPALALCGYVMWDSYQIYAGASASDALLQYKPEENGGLTSPSLEELALVNPDVRAWLTVYDTPIDYPVLQGDDNVKYVNTDVYGEFRLSGSIFLDAANAPDFSDSYSLLYGHHMENDAMFGILDDFLQPEYFDEHTEGQLYLADTRYHIELFAVLETDAYDRMVFAATVQNEEYQAQRLDYLKENADYYREIGVTPQDRILAMSTCAGTGTNARTILFGRLSEARPQQAAGAPG